jgi:hypothetical protein
LEGFLNYHTEDQTGAYGLRFFGNIPLSEFHELNTLGRILKEVDLWAPIRRRYRPLKDREWNPPKIYTGLGKSAVIRQEFPQMATVEV